MWPLTACPSRCHQTLFAAQGCSSGTNRVTLCACSGSTLQPTDTPARIISGELVCGKPGQNGRIDAVLADYPVPLKGATRLRINRDTMRLEWHTTPLPFPQATRCPAFSGVFGGESSRSATLSALALAMMTRHVAE